MKKIILIIALLVSSILAEFKGITPKELLSMQAKGIPVIDIRTKQEWKDRGIIKGAKLMTFFNKRGEPLIAEFMFKLGSLVKSKDKPFIIYCAHANRSKTLGKWLSGTMGFKHVYELKGGIEYGWINKGKKVEKLH